MPEQYQVMSINKKSNFHSTFFSKDAASYYFDNRYAAYDEAGHISIDRYIFEYLG